MNFTPEQVEFIVQSVLKEVGSKADAARPLAGPHVIPPTVPAASKGVSISNAVITEALLSETVNGSVQVRIGPKAILTPSARDFLRSRGIEIIREGPHAKSTHASRWQVLVTKSTPQIAAAVESLKTSGITCDVRLLGTPAEAVAQAIGALCRGEAERIVIFTDEPEWAACQANRNDRVRAAAVGDVAAVERVQLSLKANVLAINPAGRGVNELSALLREFT
jgi:hypothetical protein